MMTPARRVADDPFNLAGLWGLSGPQAAKLCRHCTQSLARRGELIARRGAQLPGVFAVRGGTVKLSLHGPDGEERVLRIVGPGESFGEPTALLGKPCLYDAHALTDAKLVVVPVNAVFSLLRDPRFARRMVLALAERALAVLVEFESATTQRGAQRLAAYIESLARQNAAPVSSVQLPVSKTVVAALLGMKKETLSRLLHQFAADGIIGVERREIAILDPRRLSAAAHDGQAPTT